MQSVYMHVWCFWAFLASISDIFLISVYIKKALRDFDFNNVKVKLFRIETIIFSRNWPMKIYLSCFWKTALQSSFPSRFAMTFQKQNMEACNYGEFLDCFCSFANHTQNACYTNQTLVIYCPGVWSPNSQHAEKTFEDSQLSLYMSHIAFSISLIADLTS